MMMLFSYSLVVIDDWLGKQGALLLIGFIYT